LATFLARDDADEPDNLERGDDGAIAGGEDIAHQFPN
jgi:hypothetical protein